MAANSKGPKKRVRRKFCRHACRERKHRTEAFLDERGVIILPCCTVCEHCRRKTKIIFSELAYHLMECHKPWWERQNKIQERKNCAVVPKEAGKKEG